MRHRLGKAAVAFLALVGCYASILFVLAFRDMRPRPLTMLQGPVMRVRDTSAPAPALDTPAPSPASGLRGIDDAPALTVIEPSQLALAQIPSELAPSPATVEAPPSLPAASAPSPLPPATVDEPAHLRPDADPLQAVEAFVAQNRGQAEATIKALDAEAEQLRARLGRVEAALARWKSLSAALKARPVADDPAIDDGSPQLQPIESAPTRVSAPRPSARRSRSSAVVPPPATEDENPLTIPPEPAPRPSRRPAPVMVPPPPAEPERVPLPDPSTPFTPAAAADPDVIRLPDPGAPRP